MGSRTKHSVLSSKAVVALVATALLMSPSGVPAASADLDEGVEAAMNTISSGRIRAHLKFLSDDLLEGRGTGAAGGDIAANYIATYLQLSALWPGGARNSYMQRVPLVGTELQSGSSMQFSGQPPMRIKEDTVLWSETQQPEVDVKGELVFVGYGAVAPEYGWDDYKGQDMTGKVLLMLVNDPPSDDPAHFGGRAMTYYGRWTYKYEIAAKKGAAGAILIHTDESAGYGWDVVRGGWSGEQFSNELDPADPAPLKLGSWIRQEVARALLSAAGQDFDALREAAARAEFTPVPLGIEVSAHIVTKVRKIDTTNVIAYVPGTDDALKDQAVIVGAHYDHMGIGDPDETGDNIYNGAYDNASGVAAMLDLARAFRLATVKPRRSVVFIALAAEEQGLLGSEYYATHPTFPADKIAANFNLDGVSVLGVTQDMIMLGGERSSLEGIINDAAEKFGFEVKPDAHPEQGFYYRSDHFNFAKIGVPSVSIEHGMTFAGKDPGWGDAQWKEYNETKYHRPSDEYEAGWDLDGAEKTAKIAFYMVYRVAMADDMPVWKPGDEFEAIRLEALKATGTEAGGQ